MEQLVILLVIGLVGIIKWFLEKAAEQRAKGKARSRVEELEQSPPSPRPLIRPVDPFPTRSGDPGRRLREALGLPEDAPPPLPRRPLPTSPALAPVFRREDIRVLVPADLERRVIQEAPQPSPKRVPVKARPPVASVPPVRPSLSGLLDSREGLRKAILAQEILGTPKGLVF